MPYPQKIPAPIVQKLIKAALAQMPTKTDIAHKKMLEILAAEIAPDDLELFNEKLLIDMAAIHWSLANKRKHGEPKIQITQHAAKSGSASKTMIDIVSDDMAFLVDSVVAEINRHKLLIDLLLHPIVYTKYDEKGTVNDFTTDRSKNKGLLRQSHIHIQIKDTLDSETLKVLKEGIFTAMGDVYFANRDWKAMLSKLSQARDELADPALKKTVKGIEKYSAFLDYLYDNNFTLLGYREYEFVESKDQIKSRTVKGSGLGLLADDLKSAYISETDEGLPRNLQELRRKLEPVSVSKTNRLSTVHRRVPMDAVAIKTYDAKRKVTGEKLFLGLFTSVTYSRSVGSVPYLREKVQDVMEMSGFLENSHDYKALRHILERYPRDELFQIDAKQLLSITQNILRLQERQRIALFMRQDPFGRYMSCLIYIPRDRFSSDLRQEMIRILEAELSGECWNFYTSMDDSVFARVIILMKISQKNPPKFDPDKIEILLQDAGKTWAELLSGALAIEKADPKEISDLTLRYGHAFPIDYTARYRPKQAVFDIEKIESVVHDNTMNLDLYRPLDVAKGQLRLKIYNPHKPITLSDVLPILENMGLRAIAELPFEVKPKGYAGSIWIHDFLLEIPELPEFSNVQMVKKNFERAFCQIWFHHMENDSLNRLALSANLNWHEISALRTYVRYMRQIRSPYSVAYIERALTDHSDITCQIIELFKAYHNPENGTKSDALARGFQNKIEAALEKVESLDQDRILRMVMQLISSTLRTNYYQRNADGSAKTYIAIKIDSRAVADIPDPKPYREIFVYSPQVEAVHLRGDKISRGGLRWSDRHEDFRTEVLGLMKAQMVKNSVIVPMGAKGGFVVKTPTKTREEFRDEGVRCYKTFIQALLDITDNLKNNKIVPPLNVVRRDGDDPYLVVAADKGTATFSDIANSLSLANNFWLGDAFASGGSAGYDHKKMGITAKGAWESVKAHFRQLNHDIQKRPFDVAGVGDMGGDVFGNGMLLSPYIRLIGAFNHVHIFCDPDPDMAVSMKERERLFREVKGWDHYDVKKLSKGGRIFSRSEKVLTLTPEIQARFDIAKEKVSPAELMRAILKMRTDLLWFGGIGTYIKSSRESHQDVGDKANDGLRLDAKEIRAKVIGEGANLGLTQLGRIEFAERGGKINTDFLDNSGGVDSSDHEVNIKILMADIMRSKTHKMDIKARNILLEKMTDEVGNLVLRTNYQQAQAISLAELQARENLKIQEDFIQELEREHGLDRKLEYLPDQDMIEMRLRAGKGMTRPELCILLAYSKIAFAKEILQSDIPDSLDQEEWLVRYFPKALQVKYRTEIFSHRLRREIIATTMSNSLINRMGPTFVMSCCRKNGSSPADVAKAYMIVRDAFSLRALWDQIEALDGKVPADVQLKAMRDIAILAEHAVTWFLTRVGRKIDIQADIRDFGKGVETLQKNLGRALPAEIQNSVDARVLAGVNNGLPKALAYQIALMPILASACDIIRIAVDNKADLLATAQVYFGLGERFHMDWLRQQARFLNSDDYWHAQATSGLVGQLFGCQAGMTLRVLQDMKSTAKQPPAKTSVLEFWLAEHTAMTAQIDPLFAEMRRAATIDLPMLVIAEQRLRHLYGG
jgi:glutamate dehydrogenase